MSDFFSSDFFPTWFVFTPHFSSKLEGYTNDVLEREATPIAARKRDEKREAGEGVKKSEIRSNSFYSN